MTESPSNDFDPSRRDVLRSVAGVGAFGLVSDVIDEIAADLVAINVGYHDDGVLDTIGTLVNDIDLLRTYAWGAATVAVPKPFLSDGSVQTLQADDSVRYVEQDKAAQAFQQQLPWGIDRVDSDVAHEHGRTGSGGDVAIIDTGIDSYHSDLDANIGEGDSFTLGIGILSESSEQQRAERKRKRVKQTATRKEATTQGGLIPDWQDDNGHGTHCAGIVAAVDDTNGVIGVSPDATLHGVKVLTALGSGTASDIASGIEYVANQGWDAGSLSLGLMQDSALLREACQYATDQGTLLVAATGNSGPCTDCVSFPAAYPEVVGVGATTSDDALASFSSTGPEVDLVAPGANIRSTYLSILSSYQSLSGTSMACPHVAGVGGMLMNDGYSNTEAAERLTATAEDIGLSETEAGTGLLDVPAAVGVE
ncbi:S8 family peptidase [Halocatena pleomorpha]|uniref:Peptidase S8 n=1 Tax=Halocatena pleomorpha TaxID=1785090 RepID=A0A3P3RJQ2_9EURY|nr:S8 family peptidase [Halocatena pleomorpha]RRJ33605.1 peptidase S8 [Halocatena pleomorpha]